MAPVKGKSSVTDRDLGWGRFFSAVNDLDDLHAKVGVLADTAQGGLHVPGGQLTVAEIAAVNEFGTSDGRIPERSFIRSTFDKMREELERDAGKLVALVLDGAMTAQGALGVLGAKLAAEMKKTVTVGEGVAPANAPSTVRRKGSARTLVDTGRMVGAITWVIFRGE